MPEEGKINLQNMKDLVKSVWRMAWLRDRLEALPRRCREESGQLLELSSKCKFLVCESAAY